MYKQEKLTWQIENNALSTSKIIDQHKQGCVIKQAHWNYSINKYMHNKRYVHVYIPALSILPKWFGVLDVELGTSSELSNKKGLKVG